MKSQVTFKEQANVLGCLIYMVWEMVGKPTAKSLSPKERNPNYYLIYMCLYTVCFEGQTDNGMRYSSKIEFKLYIMTFFEDRIGCNLERSRKGGERSNDFMCITAFLKPQ